MPCGVVRPHSCASEAFEARGRGFRWSADLTQSLSPNTGCTRHDEKRGSEEYTGTDIKNVTLTWLRSQSKIATGSAQRAPREPQVGGFGSVVMRVTGFSFNIRRPS